jgi:hypothetical protein
LSENFNGQERIRTSEAQVQQISRTLELPQGLDYLIILLGWQALSLCTFPPQ